MKQYYSMRFRAFLKLSGIKQLNKIGSEDLEVSLKNYIKTQIKPEYIASTEDQQTRQTAIFGFPFDDIEAFIVIGSLVYPKETIEIQKLSPE